MYTTYLKLKQDTFSIPRLWWLGLFGRKIYYDDIDRIDLLTVNGNSKKAFILLLKNNKKLRVTLSTKEKADKYKTILEEIINPKVIKDEAALPIEDLPAVCKKLYQAPGPNIRNTADFLISQGICHSAGDIYLETRKMGLSVSYKIDGFIFPVVVLKPEIGLRVINCIKVDAGMILYRRDMIQEGRITRKTKNGSQDIRVSVIPSETGERVSIRLFDKLKGMSGIEDLGFSTGMLTELKNIAKEPQGLYVICGPAGSGKTTTLYALLRYIQEVRGRLSNIITLEDPVEYRIENITQVQIDVNKGPGFADALKSSLRQDPGIIMVGEIRDRETADAAVRAALTGHLILSSIHCGNSAEAISRLLDLGIRPFLLKSSLKGIICQRVIRKKCVHCLNTAEKTLADSGPSVKTIETQNRGSGIGCGPCRKTGYFGRTVITEYLPITDEIGCMINTSSQTKEIEKTAVNMGMITLRQNGVKMVSGGITDTEEINRVLGQ